MRKIISLFSFLLPLVVTAQTTTVLGTATGNTTPGITQVTIGGYQFLQHLPVGYKPGQLVNVMIQTPGDGEANGPIAKDLANGFFASWNGHPGVSDTATYGLDPNLALFAVNPGTTFPTLSQVQGWITAIKSYVNVNKIGVSGLSLGGQMWTNFAYYSYSNFSQIAAFFLFSPEGTSAVTNPSLGPIFGGGVVEPTWYVRDSAYFYAGCATADPDGFYPPTLAEYDSILNYHPYRTPELTGVSCACHGSGAWGQFFSPYWVDPITGRNIFQQFMYEFPVPQAVVVTPPVIVPPVVKCPLQHYAIGFTFTDVGGVVTTLIKYSDSTQAALGTAP